MELFFENEVITIHYLEDINTIKAVWKKQPSNEQYRDGFLKCLDSVEKYTPLHWLSDISKQGIIGSESRQWMEQNTLPKVIKMGLKNVAVIVDQDIFKNYYLNRIKKTGESLINMEYFASQEDALEWIKNL